MSLINNYEENGQIEDTGQSTNYNCGGESCFYERCMTFRDIRFRRIESFG